MAIVNRVKREINIKIVYAAIDGSGREQALSFIYSKLKPEFRGSWRKMSLEKGDLILCDLLLPPDRSVPDYSLRCHIYLSRGVKSDQEIRKMVLKGADGVIFFANTAMHHGSEIRDEFISFVSDINGLGCDMSAFPLVIQVISEDKLKSAFIGEAPFSSLPQVVSSSAEGGGSIDAFTKVVRKITSIISQSDLLSLDDAQSDLSDQYDYSDSTDDTNSEIQEPSDVPQRCELPSDMTAKPFDIPFEITVKGVKRKLILSLSIRDAEESDSNDLMIHGSGYVR